MLAAIMAFSATWSIGWVLAKKQETSVVRNLMRRTLQAVAPRAAAEIAAARARQNSHRVLASWGIIGLNQQLIQRIGSTVQAGPFAGMILSPLTHKEHLAPYLLGVYEHELHPWLDRLRQQQFAQVIDVGAKFGYYAVGLARLFPGVPSIAFDTDWWARAACREMAQANNVAALEVRSFCSPAVLSHVLRPGALIISDCEGYEGELFCSRPIRALAQATMLIELHEMFASGVTAALLARFGASHEVASVANVVEATPPFSLGFLTTAEQAQALDDYHRQQDWLLLTPRRS